MLREKLWWKTKLDPSHNPIPTAGGPGLDGDCPGAMGWVWDAALGVSMSLGAPTWKWDALALCWVLLGMCLCFPHSIQRQNSL